MSEPDVIYVVRPGERNEELRMSLRSLANVPHGRIFIAGYIPKWVHNVIPVPVERCSDKHRSIENNVRAALTHPDLGERAYYFNDDFFVVEPIDRVPVLHGGPISKYNGKGPLKQRMQRTQNLLSLEVEDALLTYDGQHVPLPLNTLHALATLATIPTGVLWRTWFGNFMGIGGTEWHDCKVRAAGKYPDGPFMSSTPRLFPSIRPYLDQILPKGSPYVRS